MLKNINEICNLELNISFDAIKKIIILNKLTNILDKLFVNKFE